MTEKKTSFGRKVLGGPTSTETKHVLVNPKTFSKTLLFHNATGVVYLCVPKHFLIFQYKMSSLCPPFLSPSICWPRLPMRHAGCGGSSSGNGGGKDGNNGDEGSGEGDSLALVWQ